MKNFKKVLALVLVLATLMGFATVAGAAYKDAADISGDYTEAVKVLELIETMEGYPDGTFGPKKTITREEAAKLIAIFDNKDSDISTYYTSINPFADEKGRWGESYVGYGYRAGIIAGMNATTYAPTANVTGTQFLKMALVTLGYDQEAEGFVGSSWAVNVLALARKIGLIDDLADGWKPEADLTREEAAQILLNTLNAETVEYAQEAKQVDFNAKLNAKQEYVWNGRIYLTVAGAVSTGKELYKSFKLEKTTSYDAFWRPYTKWTKDHKSVEAMEAPKATFTTTFDACDLLVALGVKETDTKTKIVIDNAFINGLENNSALLGGNNTKTITLDKEFTVRPSGNKYSTITDQFFGIWSHEKTNCDTPSSAKHGAQGTLTQVFYTGKDSDGNKHYYVTSIDTWLAKVTKADKTTIGRDNHKKGNDLVKLNVYTSFNTDSYTSKPWNNNKYCELNDASNSTYGFASFKDSDGKVIVTYDDPTGLAKNDYVLMTYSWRNDKDCDPGVQSVDVVEAKEGRLNGFKTSKLADDPSQTRIDGEYVNDSVHFHLGFDASKDSDNFGTHAFFYDAYGNVIGMKDGADTSSYGVLDRIWLEHSKGTASVHANFVGLDGKVTEDVIVTEFQGIDTINAPAYPSDKFGWTLADYAEFVWNHHGENYKAYYAYYDYLGKASVNSKNEYTLTRDDANAAKTEFHHVDKTNVKFVKGTPVVAIGNDKEAVKVNSKTQFLVRTDDIGEGKYVAWTGYTGTDAKSIEAYGCDYVMDSDNKYAKIVYLFDTVAFTDGTVVAYVPADANLWKEESKDDGETYYILETYVNGVLTELKLSPADANLVKGNKGRFYKFNYRDINEVTTAALVMNGSAATTDFKLYTPYTVAMYNDDGILTTNEEITTGRKTMALAADCVIYSIREEGSPVVVKEEKGLEYAANYIKEGKTVYFDYNDKNDDGENQIVALYVKEYKD